MEGGQKGAQSQEKFQAKGNVNNVNMFWVEKSKTRETLVI